MTVLQIEQILQNFEDPKIANFFNLEEVNFRVTLVIYGCRNNLDWSPTTSTINWMAHWRDCQLLLAKAIMPDWYIYYVIMRVSTISVPHGYNQ